MFVLLSGAQLDIWPAALQHNVWCSFTAVGLNWGIGWMSAGCVWVEGCCCPLLFGCCIAWFICMCVFSHWAMNFVVDEFCCCECIKGSVHSMEKHILLLHMVSDHQLVLNVSENSSTTTKQLVWSNFARHKISRTGLWFCRRTWFIWFQVEWPFRNDWIVLAFKKTQQSFQ